MAIVNPDIVTLSELVLPASSSASLLPTQVQYPITAASLYLLLPLAQGTRQIRILDIHPPDDLAAADDGSPLRCNVRIIDLAESPVFNALSYVWGPTTPGRKISCSIPGAESVELSITSNCHMALFNVWKQCGPMSIWVDAICINQDDISEKVDQIAFMEEIYSWASTVYVWLGSGTVESDAAMDYCRRESFNIRTRDNLAYIVASKPEEKEKAFIELKQMFWHDRFSRKRFEIPPPKSRPVVSLISNCEWATRAWTFQELILASRPILLMGDKQLHWRDMIGVLCPAEQIPVGRRQRQRRSRYQPSNKLSLFKGTSWPSLMSLWLELPRPYRWNGEEIRKPIPGIANAAPFKSYLELKNERTPYTRYRERMAMLTWIPNLILFPLLLAACGYGSYKYFVYWREWIDNPDTIPSAAATAIEIFGWVLICAFWILAMAGIKHYVCGAIFWVERSLYGPGRFWPTWAHGLFWFKIDPPTRPDVDPLFGLVEALRQRRATHAADKAFALAGVLRALGAPAQDSPTDYNRPLRKTYQLLFEQFIRWRPESAVLLLLAGGEAAATGEDRPSWVPNFADPQQPWLTSRYDSQRLLSDNQKVKDMTISGDELSVTGRYIGRVTFQEGLKRISVRNPQRRQISTSVATICMWVQLLLQTASTPQYRRMSPSHLAFAVLKTHLLNLMDREILKSTDLFDPSQHGFEHFCRIYRKVVCTFISEDPIIRESLQRELDLVLWRPNFGGWDIRMTDEEFHRLVKESRRGQEMAITDFSRIRITSEEDLVDFLMQDEEDRKYWTDLVNSIVKDQRCLFILSTGFVGTGPLAMKNGDFVVQVDGLPTPMVLRRSAAEGEENDDVDAIRILNEDSDEIQKYRVVGPCFVHGHMEDQAVLEHDLVEKFTLI